MHCCIIVTTLLISFFSRRAICPISCRSESLIDQRLFIRRNYHFSMETVLTRNEIRLINNASISLRRRNRVEFGSTTQIKSSAEGSLLSSSFVRTRDAARKRDNTQKNIILLLRRAITQFIFPFPSDGYLPGKEYFSDNGLKVYSLQILEKLVIIYLQKRIYSTGYILKKLIISCVSKGKFIIYSFVRIS